MWKNITFFNKKNIIYAINDMISNLEKYKSAIVKSESDFIYDFLENAVISREKYETGRKTIMNLMYELNINVENKPGAIAGITSKLDGNNINIKNIYIAESRDNELGCLRLVFDSKDARDDAVCILGIDNTNGKD